MEIRINLLLTGLLAALWAGLTASGPAAALDPQAGETRRLTELEDAFARDPADPRLARELVRAYLEVDRPLHAIVALHSTNPELLERPRVAHRLAQAYEAAGRLDEALATAERARERCARRLDQADALTDTPAPQRQCDVHTYASLRVHQRALEHMTRWGVTDPKRDRKARLAYDVALRRARIASAD